MTSANSLNYLSADLINQFISAALAEDVGDGDFSSLGSVPEKAQNRAHLLIKGDGVIAGIELAKAIFSHVDSQLILELKVQDGDKCF